MKGNLWLIMASCLLVGILGFLAGKFSGNSNQNMDPADDLMRQAQEIIDAKSRKKTTSGLNDSPSSSTERSSAQEKNPSWEKRMADMEEIVREENALSRSRAMLAWIDTLAPSEFQAAVEHFRRLGLTQERMGEYALLLTAWAEVDPQAALAYTTENTEGTMASNTIISVWADRDPEAALAWAKENFKEDGANPYLVGIIRSLAAINPDRATEILQTMPFSEERGKALNAILPHLLKNGVEAAKAWIMGLSDKRLQEGAMARLAPEIAKSNPEEAANYLLANPNDASSRALDDIYSLWSKKTPEEAMKSFYSLPQGEPRKMALRGIILAGTENDPESAAKLMNQYPEDINDGTAMRFVWYTFDKNPSLAVNQIRLIKDEGFRNRMYVRSLSAWIDKNPQEAQGFIRSSNLSPEIIQRLPSQGGNP